MRDRQAAELGRRGQQGFVGDYSYEAQVPKLIEFYQGIVQG